MIKNLLLIVIFMLTFREFFAQNHIDEKSHYSMINTAVGYLKSKSNNIKYKLYISYPKSYADSLTKKYPVLYLLDADYSFAIAKNITDHLSERNYLQEMIIVGIAYDDDNYRINRTRDYTPTNSKEPVSFEEIQNKYSGGGAEFSLFIEKELVPFIDKNCRSTDFRVITGHSYGGLFSTWILLTKPELFSGYIIVSPSLWYDNHLMFKIEDQFKINDTRIKAYFTVGNREVNQNWNMPKDLSNFVKIMEDKKLKKIETKLMIETDENHNSIFPIGLSKGLRYVFNGI